MNRLAPPDRLRLSSTQLRTLLTCPHQFSLRSDVGAIPTHSPSRWLTQELTEILRLHYREHWSLADSRAAVLDQTYPPEIRADLDVLRTDLRARAARDRVDCWAATHLPLVRWGDRAHAALVYRRLHTVLDDPALLVPAPLAVNGVPLDQDAVGDLPMLPPLTFASRRIALDQPPFVVFRRDGHVYAASYRCAAPTDPAELRYDMELALFHEQLAATGVVAEAQIRVGYLYVPLTDTPITPVFVQQDVLRQRQRLRVLLARAEHALDAGDFPAVRGLHDGFPSPCLSCGVKHVCAL